MLNIQLTITKLNKVSRANILSSGFTLIELLVVIVILAILAVAVIVAINPAQRIAGADNSKTKSDLSSFGSAAAVYDTDYGSYPQSFGGQGFDPQTGQLAPNWTVLAGALDGIGLTYTYKAVQTSGDATGTCSNTVACGAIAISGSAINDGTKYGTANVATGEFWCYRSSSGQVTLSNAAAAYGTYAAGTITAGALTGANCTP